MPDQPDRRWEESDHDRITRMDAENRMMREEIKGLKEDRDVLMADRAKLIGWCAGASAAVAILVKVFWPGH